MTLWDIRRTCSMLCAEFERLANFHYVTIGYKEVEGKPTRDRAIKIYVKKKLPRSRASKLATTQRVAKHVDARAKDGSVIGQIPTDVCVAGQPPTAFGIRSGHVLLGFDADKGVCALTFSASGHKYLLTNAHVVIDVEQGLTGSVRVVDSQSGAVHEIGSTEFSSPLQADARATSDFAIVKIKQNFVVDDFMTLGRDGEIDRNNFGRIRSLVNTEYRYNVGAQEFHCGLAEPVLNLIPILVDDVVIRYANCWQLRMTRRDVGRPGHSGALLCHDSASGTRACGLLFAGSVEDRTIFAYPFAPIMNRVENVLGAPVE